jgi:hypothetical protein
MNFGTFDNPAEAIAAIPNGRFFKIGYITELPLKGEFKKADYKIYKYTSRITRTGVAYNNLKDVKENNKEWSKPAKSFWKIKNKIKTNISTGKDYIIIVPMNSGEHKSASYKITQGEWWVARNKLEGEFKDMVIPSYFTKSNGSVRNIDLDNIIFIRYGGEVLYARNF